MNDKQHKSGIENYCNFVPSTTILLTILLALSGIPDTIFAHPHAHTSVIIENTKRVSAAIENEHKKKKGEK